MVSPVDAMMRNPNLLVMPFLLLSILVMLGLGFVFLVLIGNLPAMKFLAKIGLAVFSRKIDKDYKLLNYVNKDGVGWLHIPNIIYSPIMRYSDGLYKNHNFLKKPTLYGEIFISEVESSQELMKISNKNDNRVIQDLTLIRGSAWGNQRDLRHANFSSLRKIVETIEDNEIVTIYEESGKRIFIPVAMVDITKGDKHKFEYTSREKFIDSILNMAQVVTKSKYNKKNDVILLQCKTEIDTLLVLLIEKGEE